MKWLWHMRTQISVRHKTQMMITVTLIAVLTLAVSSVYFSSRTKAAAHRLMENGLGSDRVATRVELLLQSHSALVTGASALESTYPTGAARMARQLLESEIRTQLTPIPGHAGDDDQGFAIVLRHLEQEVPELAAAGDLSIPRGVERTQSRAKEIGEARYFAILTHLLNEISEWRAQQGEVLDQRVSEFFGYSDKLVGWIYAGTLCTVLVGVLSLSLMERLLARMGALQHTMLRLANRDLETQVPSLGDGDEIGEVARSIEVFKRNAIDFSLQQEELGRSGLRFEAALNNMSQGLVLFDSGNKLAVFNKQYCEIFKVSPIDLIPGMDLGEVIALVIKAGNYPGRNSHDVIFEIKSVTLKRVPVVFLKEVTPGRIVSVSYSPMLDGGWVATCEDVTDRQAAEAQIRYLAQHDSLTGLPNRVMLHDGLDRALIAAGRGVNSAVLCLDLDRFKAVNDTLGHHVGDQLLRAVAERLLACVRDGDIVTRLGGDEFAIIQSGVTRPEDSKLLAERILDAMQAAFMVSEHQIVIGTSIGLALIPQDGTGASAFLKNADTALYRAKADGRGGFCFFEAEMDARLQHRRQLELDMRKGLGQHEFEVAYQALVSLEAHRVCGFEALLRWRHPERGMISPADFIPVAEEIGLIVQLGDWILNQACIDAASWPAGVKVAVNLSPVQFKGKNLVAAVARALKNSGLPAHRLELEITETVLLQESAGTLATLHELRGLGVRISMDDFGTGYSSLSYLRSFPFDKIKIDQSFIRDLSNREDSIHIVRAVQGLCDGLGMLTTAEGVETEEQLEKLRAEGCTEVQGFLFSKPRPACEVLGIMAAVGEDMRGRARRTVTELLAAD